MTGSEEISSYPQLLKKFTIERKKIGHSPEGTKEPSRDLTREQKPLCVCFKLRSGAAALGRLKIQWLMENQSQMELEAIGSREQMKSPC